MKKRNYRILALLLSCNVLLSASMTSMASDTDIKNDSFSLENVTKAEEKIVSETEEIFDDTDDDDEVSENDFNSVNTDTEGDIPENTITEKEDSKLVEETIEPQEEVMVISEKISSGWQNTDEGRVYIDKQGNRLIGMQTIEDGFYYFNENGVLQTGWIEFEEKKYFARADGFLYKNRVITFGSTWYYMGSDGSVQTGVINAGDKYYYADSKTGILKKQCWIEDGDKKYFAGQDGVLYRNRIITFGSTWYYMGSDGSVQTGVINAGDKYYYADPKTGILKKQCWIEGGEKKYFAGQDGVLYRNRVITFGSTWYYMGSDGSVQRGIISAGDKYYYADPKTGILKKQCWIEGGEKKYFAGQDGVLYRNRVITFGSAWYYMGSDGSVQRGIINAKGKYYYGDTKTGVLKKQSWVEADGKKYFARPDASFYQNCFISFGKTYYYCGSDGAVAVGEKVVDGVVYHFESNGIMKKESGWGEYNGKKYYKNPATGFPYKNQWVSFGKTYYYANAKGLMVSGWQTIGGYRYYFDLKTNVMARNTTIDGVRIGPDGKASTIYTRAAKILDSVGWNLRAAFNWSAKQIRYQTLSQRPSVGSEWFANYGFQNRRGNCYVMAATFYYMAKALGYDAHQVAGYVPMIGGGMTPHSWCEIVINGTTYVYDPDFTYETGRNGYQISYGTSGTWRYANYYRMN